MDPSRLRKPVFPPLPCPVFLDRQLSSDDIICEGSSDDEGDAQTTRILGKAEGYLRGTGELYIHSASLRGPVLKNPWGKTRSRAVAGMSTAFIASAASTSPFSTPVRKNSTISDYFSARKNSSALGVIKVTEKAPVFQGRHVGKDIPSSKYKVSSRRSFDEPISYLEERSPPPLTDTDDDFTMGTIQPTRKRWGKHHLWESQPPAPVCVEVAVRRRGAAAEAQGVEPLRHSPSPPSVAVETPIHNRPPTATLPLSEGHDQRQPERQPRHHDPPKALCESKLPEIALEKLSPEVDRNKKRRKIDFTTISPAFVARDRAKAKKRRKTMPLEQLTEGPATAPAANKRYFSVTTTTSNQAPIRERSTSVNNERPTIADTRGTGAEKPKPEMEPPNSSRDKQKGNSKEAPDGRLEASEVIPNYKQRDLSGSRDAEDIRCQAVSNYIHDMTFTEDHAEPPGQWLLDSGSTPMLPPRAAKSIISPQHAHPETPWQGTQVQLLAAQTGFFNAMEDSPIHFDTYRTPEARSNRSLFTQHTPSHTDPPTPMHEDASGALWGILQAPFAMSTTTTTTKEPEKPMQPPPVSFTSTTKSAEKYSTVGGFIFSDTELTPFHKFATPTPSPKPACETHERSHNTENIAPLNFSLFSQPLPPSVGEKLVTFVQKADSEPQQELESTQKDEDSLVALLDHPLNLSLNFEYTAPDASPALTIPDAVPESSNRFASPDSAAHMMMGMGQQGHDQLYPDSGDTTMATDAPGGSDVAEMIGIMGGGVWNIDEELRKMAGTSTPTCSASSRAGKRKGKGKKGLWG